MWADIREFFSTNFFNVSILAFIGVANLKEIFELILFVTLIIFNTIKIIQIIKPKKGDRKNEKA